MLRIRAMSPSLALLSAAVLEQGESLNLGAVQDDASLRLPTFLCAQKKTQILQFLWVLDGVQFRNSSTCFFLSSPPYLSY